MLVLLTIPDTFYDLFLIFCTILALLLLLPLGDVTVVELLLHDSLLSCDKCESLLPLLDKALLEFDTAPIVS
jgi:hypothetical protein